MPDTVLSSDDLEPIVIIDDDADFDALPALDEAGQDYLIGEGITAPETWAAFRLGTPAPAVLARLGLTGRKAPGPGGISVPTWTPEAPQRVAGLVRLNFGQSKHRFITPFAGIAGSTLVLTAPRIVLADHPLLALRLHQAGAMGGAVALVEDSVVLPPLVSWLANRDIVLVSYRADGLAAMRAALGERGASLPGVQASMAGHFAPDVRALLGMNPAPVVAAQPMSLRLLADLHAYSLRHTETAAGLAALAALGITERSMLDAFKIGYLPADFRLALTAEDRGTVSGRHWSAALVFPAFDDQGGLVDFFTVQVAKGGHVEPTAWDAPRGLIAPTLVTAFPHLVVTDSVRQVGRLFHRDVPALLLRGVADANANAHRLVAGGVKRVDLHAHRDGPEIAAALRRVGITVQERTSAHHSATRRPPVRVQDPEPVPVPVPMPEPVEPSSIHSEAPIVVPAPTTSPAAAATPSVNAKPPSLILVQHDVQRERATFQYGPAIYDVQVPWQDKTVLEVACSVGDRREQMRFDVMQADECRNFARMAYGRTGVLVDEIVAALALIAPVVVELGAATSLKLPAIGVPENKHSTGMTSAERVDALAALRDPTLIDRIGNALTDCGWVGEAEAKEALVLASISRLADEPLWLALTAGAAGARFPALRCLAALTPADQVVHVSRLTDTALFNAAPDAFRHRLLLLDDVTALSSAAATALRILHVRGAISGSQVERDGITGAMRTTFSSAQGPLAVIAAAPGPIPTPLRQHLLEVAVDESAEQMVRTVAARRKSLADPTASRTTSADTVLLPWRLALSLLVPSPVVIPADDEVSLPPIVARSQPFQVAAFSLITASALLHQHQRMRSGGAIIATAADIARGVRLAAGLAASRAADLSAQSRQLLSVLWAAGRDVFSMDDMAALLPEWTRWSFRAALDELTRLDCIDAGRGGRGRVRLYTLVAAPATAYDNGPGRVGELAAVGGAHPPTPTHEARHA